MGRATRFYVSPKVVPDISDYPFIHDLGGGYIEVDTAALLEAFLAQESDWLERFTACIKNIDERAAAVERNLPQGAQTLPATLDEADRTGYIDGLRAGARHLSLELSRALKQTPIQNPEEKEATS